MKFAAFVFVTICIYAFSNLLVVNTFDESAYLFFDGSSVPTVFKASLRRSIPFKGKLIDIFEPIEVSVSYIPLPKERFLITDKGLTVGEKACDINVPSEIFKQLLSIFENSRTVSIMVDKYPVEIFPDKVVVREHISREKLYEFISLFFDSNVSKRIVRIYTGPGTYTLLFPEDTIDFAITTFPGLGGAIIPIFREVPECFELVWNINGQERSGICASLSVGENIVECLSAENLGQIKIFVEPVELIKISKTIELGEDYRPLGYSLSGFIFSRTTVGRVLFALLESNRIVLEELQIIDSKPPNVLLSIDRLSKDMYKIDVRVLDFSAASLQVFLDEEKLPFTSGIVTLRDDSHLITIISQDNFSNSTFIMKLLSKGSKFLREGVFVTSLESVFDIGGFKFRSPYLKYWVEKNITKVIINGIEQAIEPN